VTVVVRWPSAPAAALREKVHDLLVEVAVEGVLVEPV
jgi:hypothetical protein